MPEDQFSLVTSSTLSPGHVSSGSGSVVGSRQAAGAHPRQQVRVNQRQYVENEYVSDIAVVFGGGGLSLPSVPSQRHSPLQPPMPTSQSHAHPPQAPPQAYLTHPAQTPQQQQQQASKASSSSRWGPLVRLHRRVSPLVPEEVQPAPTGHQHSPSARSNGGSEESNTGRRSSAGAGTKGDSRVANGNRQNKTLLDPPSPFGGAALELGTGPPIATTDEDEEQTLRLYATPKTTRKFISKK